MESLQNPCLPRSSQWTAADNIPYSLQWRHNGQGSISSHQPHDCLLNLLFRRRSKKTYKLRVTGLCPGEFPAQMASNAKNLSIWLFHHAVEYHHFLSGYNKANIKTGPCYNNIEKVEITNTFLSFQICWSITMHVYYNIYPVCFYYR